MKKILSVILAFVLTASVLSVSFAAEAETVILYTNDVHCAIDDYPVLAAYRAELIAQGKNVVLVDAGDAIQGEVIGALTKGEAIVDILNTVEYDYVIPGNHEFDYGMDVFLNLAQTKAEYEYISSNFYYLPDNESVFAPYAIKDFGSCQIAFVGITTPESVSKSTPEFFKDENGNFIYGFPAYPGELTNEILYENVQNSVDSAVAEGADLVVALGHMGINETTEGWKSTDIIANTDGIDCFLDAHSEEIIEKSVYKNKNDEDVFLSSTGAKFMYFGVMTVSGDDINLKLVNPDDVDIDAMSAEAKSAYDTVKEKVDGYNEDIAYLYDPIGTSEVELVTGDADLNWLVRRKETNAGDFVADAYRAITGADIAVANGGGIRNKINAGDVTRKMLMDMNPFGNSMCVLEITGQQLIDVLEHGARACPEFLGSFFQVSGISFEIHTYRETPIICDQLDNFIEIDETKQRRVQNVLVGGEPVDLEKTYTIVGSQYVLTQGGDGLTMLDDAKVIQKDGLPCDNEMLIEYFTETLNGKIPADKYSNPDGDGRITIIDTDPDAPAFDYEIKCGETLRVSVNGENTTIVKFAPEADSVYRLKAASDELDTFCFLFDEGEEALMSADDENGMDFILEYEFESGKTYYFYIGVYNEGDYEYEITLECGHSFKDEVCTICGEICDHSEMSSLGYCPCGKIYLGENLIPDNEYVLDSETNENSWFRFTPEISGAYSFKSVSDNSELDPDCFIYNAEGDWLAGSYDVNDMDFDLVFNLTAGETYYYNVQKYYGEGSFTVVFTLLTHTAADGSKHNVEYVEGTFPNCTEKGYADGLYCAVCDEFVSGHEDLGINKYYHIDDDLDEVCDLCGKENIYYCECLCHSDHWFWNMIWRIANFFHSVFGVLPECECGETHY